MNEEEEHEEKEVNYQGRKFRVKEGKEGRLLPSLISEANFLSAAWKRREADLGCTLQGNKANPPVSSATFRQSIRGDEGRKRQERADFAKSSCRDEHPFIVLRIILHFRYVGA